MSITFRNKLKTHQLPELFKKKWFEKELHNWKNNAPQPSLFDEVTIEGVLEENLAALIRKGEHFTAAKLLQSYDMYNDVDEKIMPLHWAVMNDSIELVMALLALGEDINQQDYEDELHVLPLAMMYCGEEMFNFLLLHPGINVHHEGKFIKEDAEIMQFFGDYDVHNYIYPALRLLKPEYHACHQYLNINWDVDYKPKYSPLMVYAFENYDFETMNMLVAKGADINPCIDEDYYFGPNLINFALSKYRDKPNNKNMQGIQWFAKFTKLLASESSEFTSLAEEVVDWDDDKVKNELGVKYFEELRKEYEELEKEFERFERQLKAEYSLVQLNSYSSDYPERVEVSILNDLFREKRVIPVSNIWDVKFSRVRDKLWVAVFKHTFT
ncbi:hypothetical protein [Photobacterium sp. J15]|uniref:hypothetical protein n=1 Tax=Photobacterium sp. J15 TaxID=265901 RepID=UPI0012EDC926|nr:hypothetical protein [Photobacterium sp. J15]